MTIGSQSCNSKISCRKINPKTDAGVEPDESDRVTIGDNSCNYDNDAGNAIDNDSKGVCEGCASGSIVPPFVCNGSEGIMDDLSPVLPLENNNYKCNYCLVSCFLVLHDHLNTSILITFHISSFIPQLQEYYATNFCLGYTYWGH